MTQLDTMHHDVGLIVLGDAIDRQANLDELVRMCPPPLYRWFHDQRQRILALALDAIAAGTVAHDQGAILDYLSRIRWQDALDAIKGKPLVLAAGKDLSETAMHGIHAASLMSDAQTARAGDGLTYGTPVRAILMLRNATQRRLLQWELDRAIESLQKVGVGEDPGTVVASLSETLRSFAVPAGERNLGECLTAALDQAAREADLRAQGRGRPVTWGVSGLDVMVPLRPGRMIVLSARPGGGKTSLALQSAHSTSCELGRRSVAFLSLEMTGEQLALVLACRDAVLPRRQVTEQWETLAEVDRQTLRRHADRWTAESAMWIRDASGGKPTVEAISAWIRQQKNREHGALELVVVDYLGLIKATNPRAQLGDRIAEITGALKHAALAESVCILLLAQITREGRKATRGADGKAQQDPEPRVEDLYGGSAIESDADAVVFLHPLQGGDQECRPVNAIIAKNRNGPMGSTPLAFFGAHQHFQDGKPQVEETEAMAERRERQAAPPSPSEDVF